MARKSRKNNIEAVAVDTPVISRVWNVGAYVRLSGIDRKQKGDSIENQQAIISAYIAEKSDMVLCETYIDNGRTGQNFEREGFQRMLADMESGKIDCCISKDLSRLGRNAIDTGYYIEKYFPTNGIRYIAITDNYDSADGNSSGIMVSLKNMVNETYALEVGRKVRATKQLQIQSGLFVGQYAPYGYLKNTDDCHALVVEPTAAAIVRRIFDMAADGKTGTDILEWLNGNNILPPNHHLHALGVLTKKQVSGHTLWNKGAVFTILRNIVYVGDMAQGKKVTRNNVTKGNPQDKWVVTPNTHEAIVSREIFNKVQSLRNAGGNSHVKTHEELRTENPLLRKVYCGHCGRRMFLTGKKGTSWRSFNCVTNDKYGKGRCISNRVREAHLREELLTTIQKQALVFVDKQTHLKSSTNAHESQTAELRTAHSELDRNSNFLTGLYESLVSGDINDREYRELKLSYEAKIAVLTEKVLMLKAAMRDDALQNMAKKATAQNFIRSIGLADLTPELADALIEKVTVFDDKRIEVAFRFNGEIETGGLYDE